MLKPPDEPAAKKPVVLEIVHTIQYGITPKRLLWSTSDTEILSYIDDDISSIRAGYTAWVMSTATTTGERHMACKGSAVLAFRKANERRSPSHQPKYRFDTSVSNRLLEQTRLSILSWNPGPRRGTPGAIEKHIAAKWHIIASQEAIEYLEHECFMNHFYITHFAGCAVLLNKDTFHSDIWVYSVYTYDTRTGQQQVVKEGQSGWVLQAVISRAPFRRIPRNGNSDFTMMSLHINNKYAKKRGIVQNLLLAMRTVMHQEQDDMVAGDFNGAAWRRRSGAVSSGHLVPKLSGIFACTVRSKFVMKLLESNIPTRVITTKYGFISCVSTHGWLIAHLEMRNIGGQPSGKETVRTTTSGTTWPSTQENQVAIRVRTFDDLRMAPNAMRPPRRSASEFMSVANWFAAHMRAFVARYSSHVFVLFGHAPSLIHSLRTCHTTSKAIGLLSPKRVSYTEKNSRKDGRVVLRHGRTCSKMR